MPVVREETAAAPWAGCTWAESVAGGWGGGGGQEGSCKEATGRAPFSLWVPPPSPQPCVQGGNTEPGLTHAESHLRVWDVNADSFWVQPADSQCTTVAPASAEWPVGPRTALQPVRGSGGIRTTWVHLMPFSPFGRDTVMAPIAQVGKSRLRAEVELARCGHRQGADGLGTRLGVSAATPGAPGPRGCESAALPGAWLPSAGGGSARTGHLAVGAPGTPLLYPQPRSFRLRTSFLEERPSPPISNMLYRHQLSID